MRLIFQLNIVKKNSTLRMRRQKNLTLLNRIIMKIIMIILFFIVRNKLYNQEYQFNLQKRDNVFIKIKLVVLIT